MSNDHSRTSVRLHLTNVTGAGATQLLQSLLPALELVPTFSVTHLFLPESGSLSSYRSGDATAITEVYRRKLPNVLSRVLECTLLAGQFDDDSHLLVLGDLPLRCRGPQTVFVQTPNLIRPARFILSFDYVKYWISRLLFRLGMSRVRAFIVQTEVMRDELVRSYPRIAERVHVIPQPVPSWLLQSGLQRRSRLRKSGQLLNLIYPAASYPHKNHSLLSRVNSKDVWPVEKLVLTLDVNAHLAHMPPWVHCCGFLSPQAMIAAYSQVDGLLFLSKNESYGFPLIEAMFVGLPIICPDLPYAHTLCGKNAIYFDPDLPDSLHHALVTLKYRLDDGWWPDWRDRLSFLPSNWNEVAQRMLKVACD
jgi:glycosyltransferase involved in cell wall biosynthesis